MAAFMVYPKPVRIFVAVVCSTGASAKGEVFSFSRQLFGPPSTLSIFVQSLNVSNGLVEINGGDSQQPGTPFGWDWGDGNVTQGFFPQQHVYADRTRNYVVQVTAYYPGGATDNTETVVRFLAPQVVPIQLPLELAVTIPATTVSLSSRIPGYNPPALTFFSNAHFGIVSRSTLEYVLSLAAFVQNDFVNADVAEVGAGFQQVLLRDSTLTGGGMYSLWFTNPVAFGAAAGSVSGSIAYSSFMHEMGHNFTLNSPGDFFYGGKIDGNANAIFSESMAQIFQHSAAYQIINKGGEYGLSEDLVADLKGSAISSMNLVRNSYDAYLQGGADFSSWNNPQTPQDETFGTFMTIAYKFFEQAETSAHGYRVPLRRMMQLLQILDQNMVNRYDRLNDTPSAETFRSTLMVAAVSYAFTMDLRSEFATLNFPIDNTTYDDLMSSVPPQQDEACCLPIGCDNLTMDACTAAGGFPAGAGTSCAGGACVPTIVWNPDPLSPERTTRSLRFRVTPPATATGSPGQSAIKVTMIDLQNPIPPNLPNRPPPDFGAYESATCTAGGEMNGCARWVGRPGTFLEAQDTPGGASNRAARLQCTPFYFDWVAETESGPIAVAGGEIAPSSEYRVQTYSASCEGTEASCTNVSVPVTVLTRRSGDVEQPFNPPAPSTQPDVTDVAQLVNKFKSLPGAPSKAIAQLQPNLPELNADINALDIVAVVDAVKQFAYPFSGPCECPSAVTCGSTACTSATPCVTAFGPGSLCVKTCSGGANDSDPCINDTHGHCLGGTCGAGFCRDRCGRCTP